MDSNMSFITESSGQSAKISQEKQKQPASQQKLYAALSLLQNPTSFDKVLVASRKGAKDHWKPFSNQIKEPLDEYEQICYPIVLPWLSQYFLGTHPSAFYRVDEKGTLCLFDIDFTSAMQMLQEAGFSPEEFAVRITMHRVDVDKERGVMTEQKVTKSAEAVDLFKGIKESPNPDTFRGKIPENKPLKEGTISYSQESVTIRLTSKQSGALFFTAGINRPQGLNQSHAFKFNAELVLLDGDITVAKSMSEASLFIWNNGTSKDYHAFFVKVYRAILAFNYRMFVVQNEQVDKTDVMVQDDDDEDVFLSLDDVLVSADEEAADASDDEPTEERDAKRRKLSV